MSQIGGGITEVVETIARMERTEQIFAARKLLKEIDLRLFSSPQIEFTADKPIVVLPIGADIIGPALGITPYDEKYEEFKTYNLHMMVSLLHGPKKLGIEEVQNRYKDMEDVRPDGIMSFKNAIPMNIVSEKVKYNLKGVMKVIEEATDLHRIFFPSFPTTAYALVDSRFSSSFLGKTAMKLLTGIKPIPVENAWEALMLGTAELIKENNLNLELPVIK